MPFIISGSYNLLAFTHIIVIIVITHYHRHIIVIST